MLRQAASSAAASLGLLMGSAVILGHLSRPEAAPMGVSSRDLSGHCRISLRTLMLWPWGTTGTSPAVLRDVAPRLRHVCPKQQRRTKLPHGLVVQLSLFLHLRSTCTGKAWHPSGSDESCASSVCAQSLLPLGTRFSAHSGPHTGGVHVCTCVYVCIHVHRYRYVHVHSCNSSYTGYAGQCPQSQ